jgi:hypothetical protein
MNSTSILMLLSLPGMVAAQSAEPDSIPGRRGHHALVYDAAHRRILLTGGSTPLNGGQSYHFFDELWAFTGGGWRRERATISPRSGQAVAYDGRRALVFAFGGYCGCPNPAGGALGDFLVLEDSGWRSLPTPGDRPSAEAGLVYDSRRDRLVLYGGSGANRRVFQDTWEYDGTAWRRTAEQGPGPRMAFSMVYDERRGKTLLFGGFESNPSEPLGDTWIYDGAGWTQVAVNGPTARVTAGIAYDSKRGLVILFGGSDATGDLGDTWAWNGERWTQLATGGPPPRSMGALAYDAERDRVVLFGGRAGWPNGDRNDTWEWDGAEWKEIR